MICRARPQYIERKYSKKELLDNSIFKNSFYKNRYYFTRGSYSLQFILDCYKNYLNKKLRVGVQSFTCVSVFEAIIKSGNVVCLYDVSKEDCSIDYKLIKPEHHLDVLIITHYQGIPNNNYEKICDFCKRNNIFIIEDCSHGAESTIRGIKIGTLSNVYIESYAWDKPYTSLTGGAFVINNAELSFKELLKNEFIKIPVELERKALSDIKLLYWLLGFTMPNNFYGDIDYSLFFTKPYLRFFYLNCFGKYKLYRVLFLFSYKCFNRLFPSHGVTLQRLNPIKIGFVERQRKISETDKRLFPTQTYFENANGITFFEKNEIEIKWNRYSFIVDDEEILTIFKDKDIQAGHYNWPVCLHQKNVQRDNNIEFMSTFSNSEYLANHIVNIPLWNCREQENDK